MIESAYPRNVRRTPEPALTDTPVVAPLGPRQSVKGAFARTNGMMHTYVAGGTCVVAPPCAVS